MRRVLSWLRFIICFGLFVMMAMTAKEIHFRSIAHQARKYDHANINHMKYGLFNVDLWKKKMAGIVVSEIQRFKVDNTNKEALKKHMEAQLDVLIDKVNDQIKESNKDTTKGWIRQTFMDMLVDVQAIKEGIPKYADAIVDQLTSSETQQEFKSLLKKKVDDYMKKTFKREDTSENDAIVARVGAADAEDARHLLEIEVPAENERLFQLTWKFLGLALLVFLIAGYHRGRMPIAYFYLYWATLLVLLFVGVTCPMIDMDARIQKFGFVLLGHEIDFTNQTVYFQSKSILDVFWIMIKHAKAEMQFVGVLLVLFSVIFPLLKLFFSNIYYYDLFGLRKNFLIRAIVLKSGKWSMADVMAVAILMSYIGFNGMVTTQMELMKSTYPEATFISTNGTTLQIGFFVFVVYVVLSIFFSIIISKPEPAAKKA